MHPPAENEPEFWEQRYRSGRLAWDCGGVPWAFADYLSSRPGAGRALVPGCGSGYEIRTLWAAGWNVLGLDFSPAAIERARGILGPLGSFVCLADFFTHPLPPAGFDLIYERTFLCALPPVCWPGYFRRMTELIRPGGVLCGFFFFGPEKGPPPYPIGRAELFARMHPDFEIQIDEPVGDSLPLYGGKERWQVWRKREVTHSLPA